MLFFKPINKSVYVRFDVTMSAGRRDVNTQYGGKFIMKKNCKKTDKYNYIYKPTKYLIQKY